VSVIQRSLRIDHTTLLQLAFPALPDNLASVDVHLATVPPFWHVPVTPLGMLPLATYPTELTRRTDATAVIASTTAFRYRPTGQHYLIMINAVYASSTFTTIAWTIHALEAGRGIQTASTPPFADSEPLNRPYNRASASAPQITIGSSQPVARARLATNTLAGRWALECLCTDLRIGAALRRMGQQMSVVTTLPPLPADTSRVDIVFPGLTTLTDVAVTAAPDSTFRSAGPAVRDVESWTYRPDSPHPGWAPRNWPTPVPRSEQLRELRVTVDTVVR
jgi:hypothetical protein